ncbi:hypothetical protein [Mesorhizobium sp.]|uniref:hypothetical protein n=1 Tax=Mesorhizobium sp. TaxID=1871066 RepID=UPI000FE69B56|nr:hypothetical protein [Mesorhizobium sp.]RWI35506.1 MAG: hypothetical protein EOR14_28805 [Mesorhizobium sp.]RWJ66325.1 MAG: hypothetical protein EOR34_28330 [Mesorhizobium sp.]
MAKLIETGTVDDQARVAVALGHLRLARDLLVQAKATRAAERVRQAIKSTEGAVRHVNNRIYRTEHPDA